MKKPLNILKTYFETGDTPTQEQFWNMLESFIHIDSGVVVSDRQTDANGTITLTFSDASSLTFPNYIPPTSQAISYISGLQAVLDQLANDLANKVDKVSGKELSANDFTDADKQKLDALQNYTPPTSQAISYISGLQAVLDQLANDLANKVDKVSGKELSANDFTDADKQKLDDLNPRAFVRLEDEAENVIVAADGNDTLNVVGATIDETTRSLVVSASGGSASTQYVYVNDAVGDDTTAVPGDISKPYATLDAALLNIPAGQSPNLHLVVVFTNSSTYTLTQQLQGYCHLTFKSTATTTLAFDPNLPNSHSNVFSSSIYGLNFDMPLGTLLSDAAGSIGCAVGNNYTDVRVNVYAIRQNHSSVFIIGRKVYVEPFEVLESEGGGRIFGTVDSDLIVNELIVNGTANQNPLGWSGLSCENVRINKVSGTGSLIIISKVGNRKLLVSIGNIETTQSTWIMSGNFQPEQLTIRFMDSTITAPLTLFRKVGRLTLTGIIKTVPSITTFTGLQAGVIMFKNLCAVIQSAAITLGSAMSLEIYNSYIKCGSSLAALTTSATPTTAKLINSSIEVPANTPVFTGGDVQNTINHGGLSITDTATLTDNPNVNVTKTLNTL